MLFTEHKFSPDYIAGLVIERSENLKKNTGESDLLGFGLKVIYQRLSKSPLRYLDYGPYWWALKDLLRDNGYYVGDQTDPLVSREYRGADALGTLISADEFRTDYLATQMIGANKYILKRYEPEWYVLFDADFEGRIVTN